MSHELRTPLNSIMALSRVLIMQAKNKLNDEENNYLEIVERNGKRLLALINDILDLSKIEAGKMEVVPEFVSLSSLLRMIKENLQTLADEKELNFTLSVPDNLPKIETDESRLYQVLTNIIGNAVKFTTKGSVDISVKQNTEYIFINVKDSGIGISQEMLPHIFDEFRQADGTSSRLYEGTGLGLAIAKKITEILGGNIIVKSELEKGSVFTITIPIQWKENIYLKEVNNKKKEKSISKENKVAQKDENFKNISDAHILIIDDNDDVITQLTAVLAKEAYKIDIAGGGQEALDYIQHNIPDVIILDLMMPDMDGFEVMEKIRNNEKIKNIPILVLTAKDITKDDLAILSANNIQHLIHKGDVDIKGLLLKLKLILENEPKPETINLKPETSNLKPETLNLKPETNLPNILIIEDNPDNMISLKAILKGKYNIYEAVEGEQGLKIAKSQPLDLILLDMSLPEIDGVRVIEKLKKDNKTKNIPVIAVTAQAMIGDKEKFIEAGCDGYVPKPVDAIKLIEEMEKLLNR